MESRPGEGLTRRKAIQSGALAAGLVRTAPVPKSVRMPQTTDSGEIVVTFTGGTLIGRFVGVEAPVPNQVSNMDATLTFTNGTGVFDGASGVLDGLLLSTINPSGLWVDIAGTVTGEITVPG